MKRKLNMRLLVAFVAFALPILGLVAADVSQVVTRQLWPWTTDVLVTYALTGTESTTYDIGCSVTKDGVEVPVPFGAIDWFGRFGVAPGSTEAFKWQPSKTSLTNSVSSNVRVSLTPRPVSYIVIDVSGGTNAVTYPVTSLDKVPSGGWSDEYKTTKIVLRSVPAGTFMMGSPENEVGRDADRETLHEVTLTDDFYIGVFEITCKQFSLVTGRDSSEYHAKDNNYDDRHPADRVSYAQIRGSTEGAKFPTSSDVDADSFLGRLRAKTSGASLPAGYCFDLPTEAQWEYACRGGTVTSLNNGKNVSFGVEESGIDEALAEVSRYKLPSDYGAIDLVGLHRPNALGLYDMHGNVEEICIDWSKADLGTASVTNPVGPKSGYNRIRRGGSRYQYPYRHRSANRQTVGASDVGYTWGFRLAFHPVVGN